MKKHQTHISTPVGIAMIILVVLILIVALFFAQTDEESELISVDKNNTNKTLHSELDDIEREIDILTSAGESRSVFGLDSLEKDLTDFTDQAFKEFEL